MWKSETLGADDAQTDLKDWLELTKLEGDREGPVNAKCRRRQHKARVERWKVGREEAGELGRGLTVIGPVCHDEDCRLNLETEGKTLEVQRQKSAMSRCVCLSHNLCYNVDDSSPSFEFGKYFRKLNSLVT